MTCIPIQGGGQNFVGAEPLVYTFQINRRVDFQSEIKPAFYSCLGEATFAAKPKR